MPILNYADGSLEPVREMLLHPRAASGLADGGAALRRDLRRIAADVHAHALDPRPRRRGEQLPLEWVVKKQTHDTARLYGLSDRGTLEPGMLGDLNIIDYDRLQLGSPYVVADLPAGGKRLLQRASGYVATVKSGAVTFAEGEDTGARPGVLLRGAR